MSLHLRFLSLVFSVSARTDLESCMSSLQERLAAIKAKKEAEAAAKAAAEGQAVAAVPSVPPTAPAEPNAAPKNPSPVPQVAPVQAPSKTPPKSNVPSPVEEQPAEQPSVHPQNSTAAPTPQTVIPLSVPPQNTDTATVNTTSGNNNNASNGGPATVTKATGDPQSEMPDASDSATNSRPQTAPPVEPKPTAGSSPKPQNLKPDYHRPGPLRYSSAALKKDIFSMLHLSLDGKKKVEAPESAKTAEKPGEKLGQKRPRDDADETKKKPETVSTSKPSGIPAFLGSTFGGRLDCRGMERKTEGDVDRYEKHNKISEGVYGVVYKGRDTKTGEPRALKLIRSKHFEESQIGFPPYLLREFDLIMRIDHPNVVRALELTYGQKEDGSKMVFIVMEYAVKDLKGIIYSSYLHFRPEAPWLADFPAIARTISRTKCIMQQMLRGLAFLHQHGIIHRDMKCSNVLVDAKGIVKICDFGLARLFNEGEPLSPTVVTLLYRGPEIHFGIRDYTTQLDMWAAGCIMFEVIRMKPLFVGADETEHFTCMCNVLGEPTERDFQGLYQLPQAVQYKQSLPTKIGKRKNIIRTDGNFLGGEFAHVLSDAGHDLLMSFLKWNPKDRCTAAEALQHPWFAEEPLPCDPSDLLVKIYDERFGGPPKLPEKPESPVGVDATAKPQADADDYAAPARTPSAGAKRLGNLKDEEDASQLPPNALDEAMEKQIDADMMIGIGAGREESSSSDDSSSSSSSDEDEAGDETDHRRERRHRDRELGDRARESSYDDDRARDDSDDEEDGHRDKDREPRAEYSDEEDDYEGDYDEDEEESLYDDEEDEEEREGDDAPPPLPDSGDAPKQE